MADQQKQGQCQQGSAGERLTTLLTFDPSKKHQITADLFAEVVKEIKEERGKEAKAKAKEHLVKAMALKEQMDKARRDFSAADKKFEKELGKMLNQIHGMLSGKSPEEVEEESKEKDPACTA